MTPAEQRVLNQVIQNMINQSLRAEQLQDENAELRAKLAVLEAEKNGDAEAAKKEDAAKPPRRAPIR